MEPLDFTYKLIPDHNRSSTKVVALRDIKSGEAVFYRGWEDPEKPEIKFLKINLPNNYTNLSSSKGWTREALHLPCELGLRFCELHGDEFNVDVELKALRDISAGEELIVSSEILDTMVPLLEESSDLLLGETLDKVYLGPSVQHGVGVFSKVFLEKGTIIPFPMGIVDKNLIKMKYVPKTLEAFEESARSQMSKEDAERVMENIKSFTRYGHERKFFGPDGTEIPIESSIFTPYSKIRATWNAYMNHSEISPNIKEEENHLIVIKPIVEGEELLYNYKDVKNISSIWLKDQNIL